MEHIHTKPYFANGKIVCIECMGKRDTHKNECFCSCHSQLKLICPKCKLFHNN